MKAWGLSILTGLAGLMAGPATACGLALVLALDVSASIDAEEYRLQQEGLAAALTDPAVVAAIVGQGGIWLTAYEWSGPKLQHEQLGWRHLVSADDTSDAAEIIRATERQAKNWPTALGAALTHGLDLLDNIPEACSRRVIDVASDGANNDGLDPGEVYDTRDMAGVTVNALVIEDGNPETAGYYTGNVITGPGAFVERAASYADYTAAMTRKLLREIGVMGLAMGEMRAGHGG